MPIVLFGNILSFAGCTLMVLVGLIKDKRRILYTQCVQFTLQGAANLILGGTSGFIANIVSIVRNLVFSKWKSSLWLKIGFIILQLLLALSTLAEGAIALLPIASTVLFTWFIDTKSEVKLKIVIISTQIHKGFMGAPFYQVTLIKHQNKIRIFYGGYSVSYYNLGSAGLFEIFLN